MENINVAVIGVGHFGQRHAEKYKGFSHVSLRAVCDIDQERGRAAAQKYHANYYRSTSELLEGEEDLQAVSVCTWPSNLARNAELAISAGKHVMVEKPMALNVPDAEILASLAEKKRVILSVGFLTRFDPKLQRLKKAIVEGTIGDLVQMSSRRDSPYPDKVLDDVGIVKDVAIHDIDIARHLFGSDPVEIRATGTPHNPTFEDNAEITLEFGEGRTAIIESNWLSKDSIRQVCVTGTKGSSRLDYLSRELTILGEAQLHVTDCPDEDPLGQELDHFTSCILKHEKPLVTALDGIKALRIAEEAVKSLQASQCHRL